MFKTKLSFAYILTTDSIHYLTYSDMIQHLPLNAKFRKKRRYLFLAEAIFLVNSAGDFITKFRPTFLTLIHRQVLSSATLVRKNKGFQITFFLETFAHDLMILLKQLNIFGRTKISPLSLLSKSGKLQQHSATIRI